MLSGAQEGGFSRSKRKPANSHNRSITKQPITVPSCLRLCNGVNIYMNDDERALRLGARIFVPGRRAIYQVLPLPNFSELWASPPTPHTNRGSVRPRRLDTAHSATNGKIGAMPLAPAAYEDLCEGRWSCLGAQCNHEGLDKDLEQGPLYVSATSPG